MDKYPSNSIKPRESKKDPAVEKKIEKVVTGAVKQKKKSSIQKFTDVFIAEDANNVKSYILMDVLAPAIKKAISDIIKNGIDMLLYGETGRSSKRSSASKVSYSNFYDRDDDRFRNRDRERVRTGFDYDDIIFDSRGDAEAVLTEMENVIDQYNFVSVGDLYDMANISTSNFAVNRYGWTNLSSAKVVATPDGYVIKLPKAMALN